MAGRKSKQRRGLGRAILVLALLPALLCAPALGGVAAWIHSHGHSGAHVHLLPEEHDHDFAALDEWHATQHRGGHEQDDHGDDDPAPQGLLIELPELVALAPRVPTGVAGPSAQALAPLPLPRWHLAPVASSHRSDFIRSGWPPQATWRSGVAALLRSSHALLI